MSKPVVGKKYRRYCGAIIRLKEVDRNTVYYETLRPTTIKYEGPGYVGQKWSGSLGTFARWYTPVQEEPDKEYEELLI